jgi:GDP-4-dehydro-6-deoxy-D-mannose reductase
VGTLKALITGQSGFVGQHLTTLLEAEEITVVGYNLGDGRDVRDYECLRECLTTCAPDLVFHLAAQPSPAESWTSPARAFDVIQGGALNLLEAARQTDSHARILLVGSESEYGNSMRDSAVTEDSPCWPVTPYAAAKLTATNLGLAYTARYDLHVVVCRPAYHTGPGQHPRYAVSAFARRVALAERTGGIVEHGNLSAVRAMLDVRDVVRAYRLAIDLEPGIYNVATEWPWSMRTVLDHLVGRAVRTVKTKPNPQLGQLADSTPWHPMSYAKLAEWAGWEPEIPFSQTLDDLLRDWRGRL